MAKLTISAVFHWMLVAINKHQFILSGPHCPTLDCCGSTRPVSIVFCPHTEKAAKSSPRAKGYNLAFY